MEVFTKRVIPIFLTLLTLFSIILYCAFAENQNILPSPGLEASLDQMKTRMTESVNRTIEALENSKEDLDDESLEDVEQLITDLKAIQEEISGAETEDELFETKNKLDTLLDAAPEELKSIPGLIPPSRGPGPGMQNGTENFSQGFDSGSERRPEMMTNRSQLPRDKNATVDRNEIPARDPEGMEEKGNFTGESGKETSEDSGFLEKLVNALKSVFS